MSRKRDILHESGRPTAWMQIEMANLIPGGIEPPDFPATDFAKTTRKFELFLDHHFPRGKFAELRHALDQASRSKATTAIQFYRSVVETRSLMRSAAKIMDWFAGLENGCPALRICSVCGRIFAPPRKDKLTCRKKCGALVRQRRKRALAKEGEYEFRRKLRISTKNDQRRKPKKEASR